MKVSLFDSIEQLEDHWGSLESLDFPFTDFDFLRSLEASGSLGERTGWLPYYICIFDAKRLVSVFLLYQRNNSYGEYIFDWDWAQAYSRYGAAYYPKLTSAIPFTPATGSKFLVRQF